MSLFDVQQAKIERLRAGISRHAAKTGDDDELRSRLEPQDADLSMSEFAALADENAAAARKHLDAYDKAQDNEK
jgi:hypothetical protein